MKIDKVIYKRVSPDRRLEPTKKVEQGTGVVLKRITSTKPMKRDSQDVGTSQ